MMAPPVVAPGPRQHWRHFSINILFPVLLTFSLCLGLIFAVIIPAMRDNIIERKKETIRDLTQAACSELAGLHEQEESGKLTRAAAQQAAIEHVRRLRYGNEGKDYFWITDLHPRMVMHPYRPDLEGQDLSSYADPAGKKLFADVAALVRERGDGYTDYLWQWKDDVKRVAPKLSYVMGFAPWGWIVGTGIYLEDVRAEIAQITHRILRLSVGISIAIALLLAYIARQGLSLERRRGEAEAALRASEEKHRVLAEGTTEGVLMVLEDRPVYANRILLDRLGYSERDLADLTLHGILEPLSEGRGRLIGRDGKAVEILLSSSPARIGDRTGQVLSIRDAAVPRKTEEMLQGVLAELQSALPLATRPVKESRLSQVACPADTPIREAAAAMGRDRAGSLLITSPDGTPVGIVTDRDLRDRVVAAGRDPSQPISAIMSAPLIGISGHAPLFEAARLMQERGIQHLVVTDESGLTLGVLPGIEVLHAQRHAVGLLLGEIARARSPAELRECGARLPLLVRFFLDGGMRVEHITRIMSGIADAITVRTIALAEAKLGPPPAAYAFLVFGSVARGEQTLATDQDNGIIYADVAGDREAEIRAYFLHLGEKVCGWLDEAGYRRCPGGAMAGNPKWCQPLEHWRRYFSDCIARADLQELLDVNIFFDFRCVYGEVAHVDLLRRHLKQILDPGQPVFFFHLAQSTLRFRPPLGFFGNIQVESGGEHAATFNIKSAIVPIVNFARLYALRHHFAETATLDRLARLRDRGLLLPSSHDEMAKAYTVLMQTRLVHQAAQAGRGEAPDNHINLSELTHLERAVLRKVFADITVFQARLQTDFARTS
jgi:signal-transduction protein with cAMP-binding, CBS, and nucleotidyltransferase domain/PAS domain-containing protein